MVCKRSLRRWASRVTRAGITVAVALSAGGLVVMVGGLGALGEHQTGDDVLVALLFFFAGGVILGLCLIIAEMLRNEARSVRDG